MATEKITKVVDRMGRCNMNKAGELITVDTPRQDITFDGRWATWPRTEDGTRILFSCLTDAEKQAYYAYRKRGNTGSGSGCSSNNESQLKQFDEYWSELAPLLKEENVVSMFEKTWAMFPGLRIPVDVLKLVYPELNIAQMKVLGVTALSLHQLKQFRELN